MDTFEITLTLCCCFCSAVAWTAYLVHSKSSKPSAGKPNACPPLGQFTDPTMGRAFDAGDWELVRHSDSNVEWKHHLAANHNSDKRTTYKFDRNENVLAADQVCRANLPAYTPRADNPDSNPSFAQAAVHGAKFYASLAAKGSGCVPNDYSGPLFLLPGLIISAYVCGEEAKATILPLCNRQAMAQYIINHQQEDGGWGTHVSSTSTSFGTILNYVALRLLGVAATHARCCKARLFLASHGQGDGAHGAPLWAKVWLCVLGLYDYNALPSSIPPEMFLLPDWFPFHAGKTWCHARMVALPMAFLYGSGFVYPGAEQDAVIAQLRVELYPNKPYAAQSSFSALASGETYAAKPSALLVAGDFVLRNLLEPLLFVPLGVRRAALRKALQLIREEDETNEYICLGPVNKALNMVCCFAAGDASAVQKHAETMYRYLWVAEDGMKMNGYLNSMVWDASFCLRGLSSILASGESDADVRAFADETAAFLVRHQVDKDPSKTQQYRDPYCQGGWGFSTKENSYIVSDCTGEAVIALLAHHCTNNNGTGGTTSSPHAMEHILGPAVDLILWMQNEDDHAWASYEKRRGHAWYEALNPTAMFDNIMIDYSYVECTSSCVQALCAFAAAFPQNERAPKCKMAVENALPFLLGKQRADGSWFGEWGVCFLYAGFFAAEALSAATNQAWGDKMAIELALQRLAQFTLGKQNADGGWGESVESCALKTWVSDPAGSNVVSTAWAMLTLCKTLRATHQQKQRDAVRAGGAYLVAHQQQQDGDWAQQSMISGVFNKTCGITYTSYRNTFAFWALAEGEKESN